LHGGACVPFFLVRALEVNVSMSCHVYVDFDGTIAPDDPTDSIFGRFADPYWQVIEEEWQQGRASSLETMQRQVALIQATPEALDAFVATVRIDPGFPEFVRVCKSRGASVSVVSDGFDRVVGAVLAKAGLNIPYRANAFTPVGSDRWQLKFPHKKNSCISRMGNCKCSHQATTAGALHVMVGDGRSDFCIAEHSHLVLAKGRLIDHCRDQGLPHVTMIDFKGVTGFMAGWLDHQLHQTRPRVSAGAGRGKEPGRVSGTGLARPDGKL
jgi:2-hydroxy-3-keto-5-methylthiopentenyl-1-phosphate phosphatase